MPFKQYEYWVFRFKGFRVLGKTYLVNKNIVSKILSLNGNILSSFTTQPVILQVNSQIYKLNDLFKDCGKKYLYFIFLMRSLFNNSE